MIVLNDVHLGAVRSAGTTPASALALRHYGLRMFRDTLDWINEDLIILGDLFDSYSIAYPDLLETYECLRAWLEKGHKLHLVPGNHDLSMDSGKFSSFQFMSEILRSYPNVKYHGEPGWVEEGHVYTIGHLLNQDLFDLAISRVPECKYLLVHCNYDNFFARESDHSLNMSEEQVRSCRAEKVVFAHEHNHRIEAAGHAYILGNQWPMSISDCLSPQDKYMHRLGDEGIERILTWKRDEQYVEIDWKDPQPTDAPFVRLVGSCEAVEAADMASFVQRYRRASGALIVGNAIKVTAPEGQGALELESLEAVRGFDVMKALKSILSEEHYKKCEVLNELGS